MTDHVTEELGEFFDYMWEDTRGFVYLPVEQDGRWMAYFFSWPAKREAVIRHVLKWAGVGANVFFSPALYGRTKPHKENVIGAHVLWVDFDGNAPMAWAGLDVPEPTLIVQSSLEEHQHCYWKLDTFLSDVPLLEERNRAIAYSLGADTSGWDADQILRPIHTTNQKRGLPVIVKAWNR